MTTHLISTGSSPSALLKASERELRLYRDAPAIHWEREGFANALSIFRKAARRVPAYCHFLKKNRINPQSVRTPRDFRQIPATSKENYIAKYEPDERSLGGDFTAHRIIAASSGTSGKPNIWPRDGKEETMAALTHLILFRSIYEIDKYPTLAVICFPLGMYVSGIATTIPSYISSIAHPNLSILAIGNNKEVALSALPEIAHRYKQVILFGHPFFVKELLEEAKARKIRWTGVKVRTFLCSEGFSEEWRSYVSSLLPDSDPIRDIVSTYGSAELLLIGYETPLTILLRRYMQKKSVQSGFPCAPESTLFQYDPRLRYICEEKGELLFTSYGSMPLIRYRLHDRGKLHETGDLIAAAGTNKIAEELRTLNWKPWTLPIVALEGRSDQTLVFHAANIYPANVQMALNEAAYLPKLTGKFAMEKQRIRNMDQALLIHIELKPKIEATRTLANALQKSIFRTLLRVNAEYADACAHSGKNLELRIYLHTYQDPRYFQIGLKPRYIISEHAQNAKVQ